MVNYVEVICNNKTTMVGTPKCLIRPMGCQLIYVCLCIDGQLLTVAHTGLGQTQLFLPQCRN